MKQATRSKSRKTKKGSRMAQTITARKKQVKGYKKLKLGRSRWYNKWVLLAVVLLVATFGVKTLFFSHAQVPQPSGTSVVSWGSGYLDVYVIGQDNAVWHRWSFDGGNTWSGWQSLGGVCNSAPAAVSWAPGRIDLFCRGGGNNMYHKYYVGSWSGWENLGGVFNSGPAVSSWSAGRLDVFGIGTDGAMYHRYFNGSWSGGWERLGGWFNSNPAAVSWGANRIDLFGRGGSNSIYHGWWDGSSWHLWENLGGVLTSAPAVASFTPGHLDLYAIGTDARMWHRGFWYGVTNGWQPWSQLSSTATFYGDPGAVSRGYPYIDIFARGSSDNVWRSTYGGTSWNVGYTNIGGNVLPPPAPTPPPSPPQPAPSPPPSNTVSSFPINTPGPNVGCTSATAGGCNAGGTWWESSGTSAPASWGVPAVNGTSVLVNVANGSPYGILIDDQITCPTSQSYVTPTTNDFSKSSPQCESEWAAFYGAHVPHVYAAYSSFTGCGNNLSQRFPGAITLYEWYTSSVGDFCGTNPNVARGAEGYFVNRFYAGNSSLNSPGSTPSAYWPGIWNNAAAALNNGGTVVYW